MIRIVLGLVGSGKTASIVREMANNPSGRMTFTNIRTFGLKNVILITSQMIIHKELIGKKRDGTPIYKMRFHKEFWQHVIEKYGTINIVLDEAHTLFNARRTMSKINEITGDFLAMARRIIGSGADGYGELVLITQLDRRLDPIARDMATNIRHCKCHYQKKCKNCGYTWNEHNEVPEPLWSCESCGSGAIVKCNHIIEVWHFKSMHAYQAWIQMHIKTYHSHYFIDDIERYFKLYNTVQWENMITDDL